MNSDGWRWMKRLPCDWRGHGTLVAHETCQMLKQRRVRRERAAAKHQIRTNPDEADRAPLPSGDSRYLA